MYLVTAKALAEGRGYRIISSQVHRRNEVSNPVSMARIAGVASELSFPANLPWLRLVPLLATLAWLSLLVAAVAATRRVQDPGIRDCDTDRNLSVGGVSLHGADVRDTVRTTPYRRAARDDSRASRGRLARRSIVAGVLFGAAVLTRIAGIAPPRRQ